VCPLCQTFYHEWQNKLLKKWFIGAWTYIDFTMSGWALYVKYFTTSDKINYRYLRNNSWGLNLYWLYHRLALYAKYFTMNDIINYYFLTTCTNMYTIYEQVHVKTVLFRLVTGEWIWQTIWKFRCDNTEWALKGLLWKPQNQTRHRIFKVRSYWNQVCNFLASQWLIV
jgi:hypothetical protein